jgi:dolichyl-phosphate beta-glucosyltransferase
MISLVLPAYNCIPEMVASLPLLIRQLNQLQIGYEVIIVDDFSKDFIALKDLSIQNGCIYLRNEKNYGKGYSIKRGFERARGSILIFMDGDFPFDLNVIPLMTEAFRDEKNDIVIGDRTLESSTYPSEKKVRRIGSKILSFLVNRYIIPGYPDTQCGIKGIRDTVYRNIFPNMVVNGFSFDLELLFISVKKEYRIKKIPVTIKKQSSSNVKVIYHGIEMILNIGRIYYNHLKKRY